MSRGGQNSENASPGQRLEDYGSDASRVKFDSDFGCRFAVFVDTEEEFDWNQPRSREETGTSHIQYLKEFQSLADAHGIEPCYLIDHPVATQDSAVEIMRSLLDGGRCTVGTQLHAWVNPPFDEELTAYNSFAGNLPVSLEEAKLVELTRQIEKRLGVRPIVYRAGRYGIGPNTGALLEKHGYRADVSVRPYFTYAREGGPDFRKCDSRPYWAGPSGKLLELPLGASFTGSLRKAGRFLYGSGQGRIVSALARSGLVSRVALTPEDMPERDVKDAIDAMLADGLRYLSFSFHSPSVAPGHTPYVRNSAQLTEFYQWWDHILTYLAQLGVTPVGLGETIEAATKARNGN